MTNDRSGAMSALVALIASNSDLVARLAAPLWARVGRLITLTDLEWSRPLLGEKGPAILFDALTADNVIHGEMLSVTELSHFIAALVGQAQAPAQSPTNSATLVWTLPNSHPSHGIRGRSYLENAIGLIDRVESRLTMLSPFVDPQGLGVLLSPLVHALNRGARIRLFVHDALNLGTLTSRALESLRREAERVRGSLAVYSAEAVAGRDRVLNPFFHAKLILRDECELLLGSANLTGFALSSNFEAGVLMGEGPAREATMIIEGVFQAKVVYLVFETISDDVSFQHRSTRSG